METLNRVLSRWSLMVPSLFLPVSSQTLIAQVKVTELDKTLRKLRNFFSFRLFFQTFL